ncbi:hypothetical protein B0O80DRAFT_249036 [Mortierella sp. GBAus27b]|nr:hypothetical protein B0O80DRAFT_249036 [Mortierella sp. GBAus27b]
MPLTCVRISPTTEFTTAGMSVHFGPDRLSMTIRRNSTRIQYSEIKHVNYYTESTLKIFQFSTYGNLSETSILARYRGPMEVNSKPPLITLFIDANPSMISGVCAALKQKGLEARRLTHEAAEKILMLKNTRLTLVRPSNPPEEALFVFPFNSSAKSKSIAVRAEDISRLEDGEFLNDTLIEFGLRHALATAEGKNPSLVGQVHIFNTFFYQRLVAKPAKGVSNSYEVIKSWTAKVDLFSKKYIIVPIHENLHWYLAIITNPGLLIEKMDATVATTTTTPDGHEATISHQAADGITGSGTKMNSAETHESKPNHINGEEKPYILCLDSLGSPHSTVFSVLRSYLQQELLSKKGIGMNLTAKDIAGKFSSKCPKQDNFWDCGIYLLHFVEIFLRNPTALLDVVVNRTDDKALWSLSELTSKRAKYKEIMNNLATQYQVFQFHRDLLDTIKAAEATPQHNGDGKVDNGASVDKAATSDKPARTPGSRDAVTCAKIKDPEALRIMDTES